MVAGRGEDLGKMSEDLQRFLFLLSRVGGIFRRNEDIVIDDLKSKRIIEK